MAKKAPSTREELKVLLKDLGVSLSAEVSHEAVATSEAQVEAVPAAKDSIAKNLLFKDKASKYWLCVVKSDRTVDTKALKKKVGAKKELRFARDSKKVIGCEKGCLTPLAYGNIPSDTPVTVLLDAEFKGENPISVHPVGEKGNTATWTLKTSDLIKYIEHFGGACTEMDFEELAKEAAASAGKNEKGKPASQKKGGGAKKGKQKKKNQEKKGNQEGITVSKKEDPFKWYSQCIFKSGMLERYDVSGCYVLRPWAYNIWEAISQYFDGEIKKLGVRNCYFPLFVPKRNLEREKDHVEGFAPEVAWVTRSGDSKLKEPIAIRPTSETVMYPYFKKWIRSHRDLPLKLNQWCNVVRWEFSYPTPFVRTREFLWQEGHTAYATRHGAEEEVLTILQLYKSVYEDLLAVPVIKGKKTEKEKFAGGLYTTTVEAFIPTSGRAIQGATSHCLGQNFAKMFGIEYEARESGNEGGSGKSEKRLVWQNSWGLTTRTIGVMVLVHGDDKGLVLPPRVAPIQVVIVPVLYTKTKEMVLEEASKLKDSLLNAGLRVHLDDSTNHNPGWKYNYYELKGVPLRIEIGPRDIEEKKVVIKRRLSGSKAKKVSWADLSTVVHSELKEIHNEMYQRAKADRDSRLRKVTTWDDFKKALNEKCMILAPWCGEKAAEELIKQKTKEMGSEVFETAEGEEVCEMSGAAKTLCIPFEQDDIPEGTLCISAGIDGFPKKAAKMWVMFGRSY